MKPTPTLPYLGNPYPPNTARFEAYAQGVRDAIERPIMTNPTPHGQAPEALRLADALDRAKCIDYYNHVQRDLESAAAEMAKLRGQRMVLCSLLGECLPVIDALMQMPGDDDSDARLNGLAGRIIGALDAIAEDQVKGGES